MKIRRMGQTGLKVSEVCLGTMTFGHQCDEPTSFAILEKAAAAGVNFIDTADAYGPNVADLLIKRALHPYPADLVIATKVGFTRQGPGLWTPLGRPEYLRQQAELGLRHLGLEQLPLLQLHRIDPKVPLEDQVGELAKLRDEGKIRYIGLSEITVADLKAAQQIAPIATVQNLYNLANRSAEELLDYSAENGVGFIPWFPLATGELAAPGGPLATLAQQHGATPSQLALAWLLHRSPAMLPIPGTSSVAHVEDNIAAAGITLSGEEFAALEAAVAK
jgi:pyridoxine 4-dehydrogenase